jgi:mannose-1-phosphate guanylyltransferase
MKAVILVGGEGTRLRPLTLTAPKQMLPIMGASMLERVMAQLAAHGVDEAVLSLGYLPDRFLEAYPDGECAGVSLHYAVEPEPLDPAGAVRFAAEELGVTDTFLVVNGDVLTDLDVTALVAFHRQSGAEGTVALTPVDDPSRFGVVPTDEEGRVIAFVEKPPADEAPTNMINAGTYVFEPAFLDRVPLGERVSIERATFPAMVADGVLYAMSDDAYWLDTGTPQAYIQAHTDILDGVRTPSFEVAERVGDTVQIPGSSVAADAEVRRSVIDVGCVVESGATVVDSVLLPGAIVRQGATVEGSVLGPGAVVEARATLRPTCVIGAGAVVPEGDTLDDERLPA